MKTQEKKPEWNVIKGKLKTAFPKFSNSDIEGLNGHMDQLESRVQKTYAYDKKKAASECKAFNDSLNR